MKVYIIVLAGCCETEILKIFSTEKKAKDFIQKQIDGEDDRMHYRYKYAEIEEHEVL
jgi:hypothetical protein